MTGVSSATVYCEVKVPEVKKAFKTEVPTSIYGKNCNLYLRVQKIKFDFTPEPIIVALVIIYCFIGFQFITVRDLITNKKIMQKLQEHKCCSIYAYTYVCIFINSRR